MDTLNKILEGFKIKDYGFDWLHEVLIIAFLYSYERDDRIEFLEGLIKSYKIIFYKISEIMKLGGAEKEKKFYELVFYLEELNIVFSEIVNYFNLEELENLKQYKEKNSIKTRLDLMILNIRYLIFGIMDNIDNIKQEKIPFTITEFVEEVLHLLFYLLKISPLFIEFIDPGNRKNIIRNILIIMSLVVKNHNIVIELYPAFIDLLIILKRKYDRSLISSLDNKKILKSILKELIPIAKDRSGKEYRVDPRSIDEIDIFLNYLEKKLKYSTYIYIRKRTNVKKKMRREFTEWEEEKPQEHVVEIITNRL